MTLPKFLQAKVVSTKTFTYSIEEIRNAMSELYKPYDEESVVVDDSEVINLIWELAMEDAQNGDGQILVWEDENGNEFDIHGFKG